MTSYIDKCLYKDLLQHLCLLKGYLFYDIFWCIKHIFDRKKNGQNFGCDIKMENKNNFNKQAFSLEKSNISYIIRKDRKVIKVLFNNLVEILFNNNKKSK